MTAAQVAVLLARLLAGHDPEVRGCRLRVEGTTLLMACPNAGSLKAQNAWDRLNQSPRGVVPLPERKGRI